MQLTIILSIIMLAQLSVSKAFSFASKSSLWKHSVANNANKISAMHMSSAADKKAALVERLIDAKVASKLSFDQISSKLGVTNAQTAQLFTNQAQLSPRAAELLKIAVPQISPEDLATMQKVPMRSFDPDMMQVRSSVVFDPMTTALCHLGISFLLNNHDSAYYIAGTFHLPPR
jgi:ABC-type cobalamin transport system ATPase subunit